MDNLVKKYNNVAILLHWSVALLIVIEYLIGLTMDDFGIKWLHLQIGYLILLLVIVRIVWKLTHKTPPMDNSLSRINQIMAHSGHGLLYLLMLLIPALGLTLVITKGLPFNIFGIDIAPLMDPLPKATRHNIKEIHELLAHTIIIMAALHALVALLHQFILGHPILVRMLPDKMAQMIDNSHVKK